MGNNLAFVQFDEDNLRQIEEMLGTLKPKAKQVARNAINKTVTETKKILIDHIKSRYALPPKMISSAFTREDATPKNLAASLTVKGEPLELREFKTKTTAGQGVKVKVKKDSSFESFEPKLFWADLPAGRSGVHRAIMQRSASGRKYSNPAPREAKGWDTTKIKKLIGPSIPGMVWGEGGVYEAVEKDLQKLLNKHVEEAVKAMFEKQSKK